MGHLPAKLRLSILYESNIEGSIEGRFLIFKGTYSLSLTLRPVVLYRECYHPSQVVMAGAGLANPAASRVVETGTSTARQKKVFL
jgi:hypothetical protein